MTDTTDDPFKPGARVRLNPKPIHLWDFKNKRGFVVEHNEAEKLVQVRVDPDGRDFVTRWFDRADLERDESSRESILNRVESEVQHAKWNLRDAERGVLDVVDLLVKARLKVDQAKEDIKVLQRICPHDEERIGSTPMGSYTAIYYRCKACGRDRSDD